MTLIIQPITALNLSQKSFCKSDPIYSLNSSGLPQGGLYTCPSLPGLISPIAGTYYIDPSAATVSGDYVIYYQKTSSYSSGLQTQNCPSTASDTISIGGTSNVDLNFTPNTFEECAPAIALNGGSPSGGTYSLLGNSLAISNGFLFPGQLSVGNHTIRYVYTDLFGCSDSSDQIITITKKNINLSGNNINFLVYDASSPTNIPLSPNIFSGIQTYSICTGGSSASFRLATNGLPNFSSFSIDWGDGSPIQTGYFSSINPIKQYNVAGIYNVNVDIIDSNNCSLSTSFNLFFGSTQSLGLSTPGNTTVCLSPNQDSTYFDFELSNWENDPKGVQYLFGANDSSNIISALSPLVDSLGLPTHPRLIYDISSQKLYYRHYFKASSCGYTSNLGSSTYDNSFSVSATKSSPCPGSQSSAAVAPIVISRSPTAGISAPDSSCTETIVDFIDITSNGQMISSVNGAFICDPSSKGFWKIYPNVGFQIINPPMGSDNGVLNFPPLWINGPDSLKIKFNNAGQYRVVRYVGLTGSGSNLCAIDSVEHYICIDTIPTSQIRNVIPDTICKGQNISGSFVTESIKCGSKTRYFINILDIQSGNFINSWSTQPSLDTTYQIQLDSIGAYQILFMAENHCGIDTLFDTINVIEKPFAVFNNDTLEYCNAFASVNIGSSPHDFNFITNFREPTDTSYSILPNTGWALTNLNSTGFPNLEFTSAGFYTITFYFLNSCGIDSTKQYIDVKNNPDTTWSLLSNQGCSPFTPTISSAVSTPGVTHTWKLFDSLGSLLQSVSGLGTIPTYSPFGAINNPSSTNSATFSIWHIVTAGTGCKDSSLLSFTILPTPDADFNIANNICGLDSLSVTNNSISSANPIYKWSAYDYSPGSWINVSSIISDTTDTNPTFSFPDLQYPDNDKVYKIKLIVSSADNCLDSIVKDVSLLARPLARFDSINPNCGPISITLNNTSQTNSPRIFSTYSWSISPSSGATINSTSAANPILNIAAPTSDSIDYTLTLIAVDDQGCSDTTQQLIRVYAKPTAQFTGVSSGVCQPYDLNVINNTSSSGFSSQTSPAGIFSWTISNNGNIVHTSNLTKPNFSLTNTGVIDSTYIIRLIVENDKGCLDTVNQSIIIHPDAKAIIKANKTIDCAPFIIANPNVYDSTFITANSSVLWTVYNSSGNIVYGPSSSINYTINDPNDSLWVELKAISLNGCQDDYDSLMFKTIDNPDTGFNINPNDTVCDGVNISLDINNSDTSHTYEWYKSIQQSNYVFISNNSQSLLQNPSNTDSVGFNYIDYKLKVQSNNQCSDSNTNRIYVYPNPLPRHQSLSGCYGDSINLLGASSNDNLIDSWEWIVNGDTLIGKNTKYKFNQPGSYPILLKVKSIYGCQKEIQDTIVIYDYPQSVIQINNNCGLDTVCVNDTVVFQSISTIGTPSGPINVLEWDINNDGVIEGNGTQLSYLFSTPGAYNIKLTTNTINGCSHDTIIDLEIISEPQINLDFVNNELCGPATPQFNLYESGVVDSSYFILSAFNNGQKIQIQDWSNSTPVLPQLSSNFSNDTIYILEGFVFNCCGFSYSSDSISIKTGPLADLRVQPDSGCSPLSVIILLDGFIKGGADSAFIDFGDGNFASYNPTIITTGGQTNYIWGQKNHVYNYSGSSDTVYFLNLKVFNDCGDSSLTVPVYIEPNTVSASYQMNKSSGCSPLNISFTNTSYNSYNSFWCFDWDPINKICNGTSSILNNPNWAFTSPGNYKVALFADNGCGYDTSIQNITVFASPDANFSHNNSICEGDTAIFQSTSSINNGLIVGHNWYFGDGDSSILQNPKHVYQNGGNYNVKLIITSSNGCQDSIIQNIVVLAKPQASFNRSNICLSDTAYFTNTSTISTGSLSGVFWDFGDGNTSNIYSPKHKYQISGTYTVRLKIYSQSGCVDSVENTIIIHPLPELSFTASLTSGDSCSLPQTYTFTNTSINTQQYFWDFDFVNNPGINTSSLTNPSIVFLTPGVYTIMLTGETGFNCRDSLFKKIIVRDGVEGKFNIDPNPGCEPLTVLFSDSSLYSSIDTIISIDWDFGDGNSLLQSLPPWNTSHTYNGYGSFTPIHKIEMASGCKSIDTGDVISIYPRVVANFNINYINLNTRDFKNISTSSDSISLTNWDFGDGSFSSSFSSIHEFLPNDNSLDSIEICLYVETINGCSDSICKKIWMWPPNLEVPNAFAPGLDYVGEDALFLPKGHSLREYELIIYDSWGNQVWKSNELTDLGMPKVGWNGKNMKGNDCPMGVYVWKIRAVFDNDARWLGQKETHGRVRPFGTLNLIR